MMDPFDNNRNDNPEEITSMPQEPETAAQAQTEPEDPPKVETTGREEPAYSASYNETYQSGEQPPQYGGQPGHYGAYGAPTNQPGYGAGYNAPPVYSQPSQTVWQGSNYHSGPVYATPVAPQKPKKEKKPKKPWGRGKKLAMGAVACLVCCAVVSAASIAGFTALVNNGTIQLNTGSGSTGGAANPITINRLVNSDGSPAEPGSTNLTPSDIADKVTPSVVCIQNYQRTQQSYQGFGTRGNSEDSGLKDAGEGSGIILTADGYIVTNAHVVSGADALKVILSDGTTYEAKLIGSDEVSDLAVLKVEATGLTPAEFGDSDDLKVGSFVMALGNPGGLEFNSSATYGYVSALNRAVTNSDGYTINYLQTDAAINPGNSGGALVNAAGQVIGINTAKISDTNFEGMGFAIPSNTAQKVINDLMQHGSVQNRAALGITGRFIDSMTASFYGMPSGWAVASVSNESAQNAGLAQGCVITKIDGTAVSTENTIKSVLSKKSPGDTVELVVTNSLTGKEFTAAVTLVQATADNNTNPAGGSGGNSESNGR